MISSDHLQHTGHPPIYIDAEGIRGVSWRLSQEPHQSDAEGIKAISRWLRSEATIPPETTPPEIARPTPRIPKGCQPSRASIQLPFPRSQKRRLQKHRRFHAEGILAISRWLRSEATTPPGTTPPETDRPTPRIPEGCQPDRSSVQIPIFVFHARRFQELRQFLAERFHTVMLGLVRSVFLHPRSRRRAHRECAISLLPRKISETDLLVHPHGRRLLQFPHEARETMCSPQSHQQMHMIANAADALRKSSESCHGAAEVFVQTFHPSLINEWHAIFGGEHDVVMQSKKGRGHNEAGWLASLRDAWRFRIVSGGVASLNHRLIALMPSASCMTSKAKQTMNALLL